MRRNFWSFLVVITLCSFLTFLNLSSFVSSIESDINYDRESDFGETFNKVELGLSRPEIINFVGDIMLGRDVESYLKRNGSDYPYRKINFNSDNAYTVGNFESAIPGNHIQTPNNTFRFSTNPIHLQSLSKAGFTHMSLANNHTFDFGLPGYNNTIARLWDNDIIPFGHPTSISTSSVVVIKMKEVDVSVVAIHTLFTAPKSEDIKAVLDYANQISDYQVVYIHWGDEYQEKQSLSQRKLVEEFSKYGTDLVIGHHPHVVQGIERVNDTLVLYSLGNYIFDQYFSESVQKGLLASLDFTNEPIISLIPVTSIDTRVQPEYMSTEQGAIFLQEIAKNSDVELKSFIENGFIPLSIKLASSTEVVIMAE
jgi:poly-gamma-glutamate synthesis protein (capsule biosynthesis protein)